MLSLYASIIAFSAVALGLDTTVTSLQCRTHYAETSAYQVLTHTTTIGSQLPRVTIGFTTHEVVTLTPLELATYNRTTTEVSTITETFTEQYTGSVFSTTVTKYSYSAHSTNITETVEKPLTTTVESSIVLRYPAPEGFQPINYTAPETTSATVTGSTTSATPEVKMVYFVTDGKLSLTPMDALTGIITYTETGRNAPMVIGENSANTAARITTMSSLTSTATDSATTTPSPASATSPSSTASLAREAGEEEDKLASTTSTADGGSIQLHTLEARAEETVETTTTSSGTAIMGFQGAITSDPVRGDVVFPTLVSCTKIFFTESTEFDAQTTDAVTVTAMPVTNVITTLSMLTVSTTLPYNKPWKTESFATTTTLTTSITHINTYTSTNTLDYTRTTTVTSHLACATENFMGPITGNGSHIFNIYTNGMDKYTNYDMGFSRSAEDCCVECHVTSEQQPCLGSVFTDGRCYLLTSKQTTCSGQTSGAGFFVSRPKDEVEDWERRHWGKRLPEFVVSNGPCGYFYDGGVGK